MVESLRLAQVIPSAFLPKSNKIKQNVFFFFEERMHSVCAIVGNGPQPEWISCTTAYSMQTLPHVCECVRTVCADCNLPHCECFFVFLEIARTESGIIPELRSLMQEDHYKFKTLMGYRVPRQQSLQNETVSNKNKPSNLRNRLQ